MFDDDVVYILQLAASLLIIAAAINILMGMK